MMMMAENPKPLIMNPKPKPQVTVSSQKPKPYFCLLPLFPISRMEEKLFTELITFATASCYARCPRDADDQVSTTLTLAPPPTLSTSKKRKAVDQKPAADHDHPPKRQEVEVPEADYCPEAVPLRMNDSVEEEEIKEERKAEREMGDPWKIKKRLTESDLQNHFRLLVPNDLVVKHILPYCTMNPKTITTAGVPVLVHDCDTDSTHQLVFKYLESYKTYIFKKNWRRLFVKKRGLKLDDEIGLYWDRQRSMFMFSVLQQ